MATKAKRPAPKMPKGPIPPSFLLGGPAAPPVKADKVEKKFPDAKFPPRKKK